MALWHRLVENLAPDVIVISVARHYRDQIAFAGRLGWQPLVTIPRENPAKRPYQAVMQRATLPGATVARVVWDGESPWTATQLLRVQGIADEDSDERRSVIADARVWLRDTLAASPRLARELRQEASERGIGRSTLYAARKAEAIIIAKERTAQGRWIWSLSRPGDLEGALEDVAPPGSSEVQHL